ANGYPGGRAEGPDLRTPRSGGGERRGELGARARLAVAVEQPEGHVVAERPLVVVDAGPVEEAADVDAVVDRLGGHLERLAQDVGAPRVVVGADAVLAHEERPARQLVVQAAQDDAEPLAPRGVAERSHARTTRVRREAAVAGDRVRRVIGEPDQVAGLAQV